MYCFNKSDNTNISELTVSIHTTTQIVLEYGIHGVSFIWLLYNTTSIIVMMDHQSRSIKSYHFLSCRCIRNLLVCLLGYRFIEIIPSQECVTDYNALSKNWLTILLPLRIALMASSVLDVLLILYRVFFLYDWNVGVFY